MRNCEYICRELTRLKYQGFDFYSKFPEESNNERKEKQAILYILSLVDKLTDTI